MADMARPPVSLLRICWAPADPYSRYRFTDAVADAPRSLETALPKSPERRATGALFERADVGATQLDNRIVMAPLTRNRAGPGLVPSQFAAEYYSQRASAGLIIAEATQISAQAQGYSDTPGCYSDDQVAGWRKVTDAVHAQGGIIVVQLWHTGRVSHVSFQKSRPARSWRRCFQISREGPRSAKTSKASASAQSAYCHARGNGRGGETEAGDRMPRRGVLPSRGHRLEARGSQRGGRREANFGARLACGGMTKEWGNASSRLALAIMAGALSGCVVGPNYQRPSAPMATAYKEAIGWSPAHPSDAADRQDWWTVFNDPVLNDLEQQVQVSNQNLKAAEAAFRQAEALVSEQRAALFPTLSVTGSASKAGGGGAGMVGSSPYEIGSSPYEIGAEASWAPDVWGGVRRAVEAAKDSAQASDADLANARLSAQTSLALDYILLRQLDEEKRLQDATVAAYQRTLMVTQNRYDAGAVSVSDVLAARTQLASSQGDDTDLAQQRAKFEHAVALLAGRPPSTLTLAPIAWVMPTPDIPPEIPSGLLQRRPDIAAAERRAAAANAQIGVAVAAYFPTVTLVGQGGGASSQLGRLFSASTSFWSIGAAAAETVFDAGARSAKVKQNRAAYAQAVANYRQTVLTAFGQVEDALAAQRVLGVEQTPRDAAVAAATRNERVSLNQYQAGQVDYTTVVVAQVAALSARNTALQNQASRLANAVTLINALGGGWTTDGRPRGSVAAAAPVQSLESE